MSEIVTKAEFARMQGWDRSHVTRLAQENRLVLDGTGRRARVRVAQSLAMLAATAGNRDDVARRHAETRAPAANGGDGAANAGEGRGQGRAEPDRASEGPESEGFASGPGGEPDPASFGPLETARYNKIMAESRRAVALAEKEEIETARAAGDVIARGEVELAFKTIGATLRGLMDTFPDQVAPLVAPATSIEDCHALLAEHCRNVLVNFGATIERQGEALQKGAA